MITPRPYFQNANFSPTKNIAVRSLLTASVRFHPSLAIRHPSIPKSLVPPLSDESSFKRFVVSTCRRRLQKDKAKRPRPALAFAKVLCWLAAQSLRTHFFRDASEQGGVCGCEKPSAAAERWWLLCIPDVAASHICSATAAATRLHRWPRPPATLPPFPLSHLHRRLEKEHLSARHSSSKIPFASSAVAGQASVVLFEGRVFCGVRFCLCEIWISGAIMNARQSGRRLRSFGCLSNNGFMSACRSPP